MSSVPWYRTTVSLFSGAFGLDLGLELEGFVCRVAVDCDQAAVDTVRANRPGLRVRKTRIEHVSTAELLAEAGLRPGRVGVVVGGPSCKPFSTAGKRESVSREGEGGLFGEFVRVVQEARPRFFVMENVRGVLSAALRHRPLSRRGPGHPPLEPDEILGSALDWMLSELSGLGYSVVFSLLNAADYGVPQRRHRVLFVGSRDGECIEFPKPSHSPIGGDGLSPWVTLREALGGLVDPRPEYISYPESKARFLELVPPGGNWRDLPEELQRQALGRAYDSWGGRAGFCRRLAWDEAPPALTSRPDSKATLRCHPDEVRPLSVAEYKRLAQFPDDWRFCGRGLRAYYRQIGNAVPVGLGRIAGAALNSALRSRRRVPPGEVVCADPALAERLAARPPTVLDPPRMRRDPDAEAAKAWLRASAGAGNGARGWRSR